MKPYGLKKRKSHVWPAELNFKGKKAERQFAKKLIEGQRDLEPEFAKIVNDRFRDMV